MKTTTTPTTYYVDYETVNGAEAEIRSTFDQKKEAKRFLQGLALHPQIRIIRYNFEAKITSASDLIAAAIKSGAQLGLTPKVSLDRSISRLYNQKHLSRNGDIDKYIRISNKIKILNQALERLVRVEEQGCAQ
jgi:hypothetical protein